MSASPIIREVTIGGCRTDGCTKLTYAKGYCERHYRRFKKYGDPLAGKTPNGAPLAFLKSIEPTDCCIEWPYSINPEGYGQIRFDGKMMNAHRASLVIHCGQPDFPDLHAAHEPLVCHNRRCVNPRHLRWATPASNMQDRELDGTQPHPVGELQGASKLTAGQVAEIRAIPGPLKTLSDRYGVSKSQISRIIRRERWQHV